MSFYKVLLVVFALGFSVPAFAYIDPGTGSLLIQSVIGAIAAIGVSLKLFWHKLRVFFSRQADSDNKTSAGADETSSS